ncbi:hypothetical protein LOD99_9826 [Oopsacas minuta]|uniref:Uncharacterized protein n=1 Tax=Oopsacas minuta TaxID=111878 RepID=A0AAV7KRP7_9METZ|nr:hypothetical protein LOD99_9826 [Oopsacas minuta]
MTNLIRYTLRYMTRDGLPKAARPRRILPKCEPVINRQLGEMVEVVPPICRRCNSPWSSDVVLVKKKDCSLRLAVDYRHLNAVTKRDDYYRVRILYQVLSPFYQ